MCEVSMKKTYITVPWKMIFVKKITGENLRFLTKYLWQGGP